MGNFQSSETASLVYYVNDAGGQRRPVYTTGHTLLSRVQEVIAAHQWGGLGETFAYRRGGPLGSPETSISTRDLQVDYQHGPITNGLLWHLIATKAYPRATRAELVAGTVFDAGTRNVLDKIEESLLTGTLHRTAARAMLWLVENNRDSSLTWQRFIREISPDLPEGSFVGYRLRTRLPKPRTPSGMLLLPTPTPALRRVALVLGLRRCVPLTDSVSADAMRQIFVEAVPTTLVTYLGQAPRITRKYADIAEPCVQRATARWAIELDCPDPAVFPDPSGRVARSLIQYLQARLGAEAPGWEVTATPYEPTINGELTWWSSGAAAQAATRDEPRVGVDENPEGPEGSRPAVQGTAEKALDAAKLFGVGALGLGALVLGVKLVGAVGTRSRIQILSGPRPNKPRR